MHVLETDLTATHAYPWAALGVALSVAIPILTRLVAQALPNPPANLAANNAGFQMAAWTFVKPYLIVAAFSLATAILIVAFVNFPDAKAAIIGGYAWDATLQKIRRGSGF